MKGVLMHLHPHQTVHSAKSAANPGSQATIGGWIVSKHTHTHVQTVRVNEFVKPVS